MNLKKAITIILASAMIAGCVAGCTNTSQQVNNSVPESTATTQQGSTATQEESSAAAPTESESSTNKEESTSADTSSTAKSSTTAKAGTTKKTSANKQSTTAKTTAKTTTKATTTQAPPVEIKLTKNGNATCKSSKVTIEKATISNPQGTIYIEKGGDYVITSGVDTWHGQIVIKLKNTEKANIRLENVNITTTQPNVIRILDTNITAERSFIEADASTNDATGIDTDSALRAEMKTVSKQDHAPNVDLSFPTGTTSNLTTSANSLSGVIYNESKLTIKGNGKVNINATDNRNNAICSTKSVTFRNVTASLSTAGSNNTSSLGSARGIFSFSTVTLESGKLNIKSNGDCIRCDDFVLTSGTASLMSSAADGIDADDAIIINGGSITATALKKSSFKVRRINNQELIDAGDKTIKADDGVKDKTKHTFRINGGTVKGESKDITTVQGASKQPSIICKANKKDKATGQTMQNSKKTPVKFTISGLKVSSSNECIKFLYSSAKVSKDKSYTVSAKTTKDTYPSEKVVFSGRVGTAQINTAQPR